jgi:hypothetical protein
VPLSNKSVMNLSSFLLAVSLTLISHCLVCGSYMFLNLLALLELTQVGPLSSIYVMSFFSKIIKSLQDHIETVLLVCIYIVDHICHVIFFHEHFQLLHHVNYKNQITDRRYEIFTGLLFGYYESLGYVRAYCNLLNLVRGTHS